MLKRFVKESFVSRAVMILLAILLVSLYISSSYLAKYVSEDDGTTNDSGVAVFSFNVNNNDTLNIDLSSITGPGTSQTYNFNVVSPDSNESARRYDVVVKTTNNLPLTLTLSEGVTTLDATSDPVATGIGYELTASGEVAAGTAFSKTYSLVVAWPAAQNSTDYSKLVGAISIEVSGTQID